MPGSFMQLAAFGLQDLYLVEDPQMTYWKNLYFRHTNFAIESIQQTFTGTQEFGNLISCTIPKDNGDLIGKTYISATISNINKTRSVREWSWVNKINNPSNFGDLYSQSIKISPDGTFIIITGFFSGQIIFNNTIIGDLNKSSIFVLKADAVSGDYIWIKTATNNDNIDTGMNFLDFAILSDNSVILTGYFHNSINFDGSVLTSVSVPNNYNSFIVNLSNNGLAWSNPIHIQSTDNCVCKNIIYKNNNIYIAGDFTLNITLYGTTLQCNEKSNGFICCVNSNTIVWLKQISALSGNINSFVNLSTMNITPTAIIINGLFNMEANLDTNKLISIGKCDVFITKLLLNGTYSWVKQIGGTLNEYYSSGFPYYHTKSIKVLNTGSIVLIGVFFSSSVNFDTITLTGDGNKNTYIAKISSTGQWEWAIKINNPENYINTGPSAIFSNSIDDTIFIAGSFGNPFYTIGDTTLINYDTSSGSSDTYIIKLTNTGTILWAISIGGNNSDYPANIDISEDGVYSIIIGYFDSSVMHIGDFTLDNTSLNTYTYIAKLDLYDLPYINRIGFQLLNYVELRIGGKTIDKHYSNWMYIWSELTHNIDMKQLLDKMVGSYNDSNESYTLHIPLFFSYCRHNGLALPLISLKYHDVEIYVNLEQKENIFGSNTTAQITNIDLWVDYYYLDTIEREKLANESFEYLIEIVQTQEIYIDRNNTTLVKLDFSHPTKFLAWGIKSLDNDMFDYTDLNESCFASGQLFFNNRERFDIRKYDYFNYIQPYQHFKVIPKLGINVYSFALEPTKLDPTGSCNFSLIDKPDFNITTNNGQLLYMYAFSYNVLKITDGMGGLLFTK